MGAHTRRVRPAAPTYTYRFGKSALLSAALIKGISAFLISRIAILFFGLGPTCSNIYLSLWQIGIAERRAEKGLICALGFCNRNVVLGTGPYPPVFRRLL